MGEVDALLAAMNNSDSDMARALDMMTADQLLDFEASIFALLYKVRCRTQELQRRRRT